MRKCVNTFAHAIGTLLLIFGVCVVTSAVLRAQVTSASIFGSVSDRSGAVVAGADVIVTNTDTNLVRTTKTDEHGQYAVRALPLGSY